MQIYIHRNNQQLGPFSEADVKAQLAAGTLSLQDHAWWQGQAGWVPLAQCSFIAPAAPGAPAIPGIPPVPGVAAPHLMPPGSDHTSSLAIAALVCGILGFCCGVPALAAIVLGYLALSEIKRHPAIKGHGMALAGLILGYIVLALVILYAISIIVLMALGTNVKTTYTEILQQEQQAATNNTSDQSASTNSDQPATNAPDTNATPATPATNSDSGTNAAPSSGQ